jgi:hypothetical protein
VPGAGAFPDDRFYLRAVGLTFLPNGGSKPPSGDWALVGHSGSNGDWVTPAVPLGQTLYITFPADAAPLFDVAAQEFFDVHVNACKDTQAMVVFWYVPAPTLVVAH